MEELTTSSLRTSMWWNPYTVEHLVLRTTLPADECIRRIRASIATFWSGPTLKTSFAGSARGRRFALSNGSKGYHNDFGPFAFGEIEGDAAGGSTIDIRLRLPSLLRVWITIFVLIAPLLLLIACIAVFELAARGASGQTLVAVVVPLGFGLMYPFYLYRFWLARGDRVFLVERLQKLLDATGADSGLYVAPKRDDHA